MDRKQIIEGLQELAIGERLTFENQADVCSAAIAELEALDLTPEQRAERRLRAAYPGMGCRLESVRGNPGPRGFYAKVFEPNGLAPDFWCGCSGSTPDETVDRLLARVR